MIPLDRAPAHQHVTHSALDATYSVREVRDVTGLTYRRLDHWARQSVVLSETLDTVGSGRPREWTFDTVVLFTVAAALADAAQLSLDELRSACAAAAFADPDLDGILVSVDGRWTLTDHDGVRRAVSTGRAVVAVDVTAVRERVADTLDRRRHLPPVVVANAG